MTSPPRRHPPSSSCGNRPAHLANFEARSGTSRNVEIHKHFVAASILRGRRTSPLAPFTPSDIFERHTDQKTAPTSDRVVAEWSTFDQALPLPADR
jgi:hypothetical protein